MNEPYEDKRSAIKETIKNLIAGGMGAMMARALCQPLDVTKVRFQVCPKKYSSLYHAFTDIYKDCGLKGLWRGHNVAQVSGLFQGAIQFVLYEQLNYSLEKTALEENPNVKSFVCGFLTGTAGVLIISPFEVVKTHLIAQSTIGKNESAIRTITQLFREGGLRGVYKGAIPAMLQIGPLIGSRFMFYNFICNLAMKASDFKVKNELPASTLLFAGGASGILSNTLLYPVDVIKRRMQIIGFKGGGIKSCSHICECITQIMQVDGLHGFYRGILPSLIKSAITASVTFTAFDKIKAVLDNL